MCVMLLWEVKIIVWNYAKQEVSGIMMKMLVVMDEDKIAHEGKYDLNKINAYLAKLFSKRGMTRDEDNWYVNGNFTACGSLIIKLSSTEWFMDNIEQWIWYDTEDMSTEDLKAHYSKEAVSA